MAAFRVSTWGIKNPIPVSLLFIAAVLTGVVNYNLLPIKQFPKLDFPSVTVTVTENGAAPGEMETQITRPIEDAMAGIPNIKSVQSVVSLGVSTTFVTFELSEDGQKVTDEVRTKVDQTRVVLPREIDPPTVERFDVDSQPIITYAVSAPGWSAAELSWFIDDTVARALEAETGVARVSRVGGADREINIIVDPQRMAAHGLTASGLNAALTAFDVNHPGGRLRIGGREQTLRIVGEVTAVDKLRDLTIPTGGGQFVRLSDVATIGDGQSEQRGFARLNDRPAVGFQVLKTSNASEIQVEDRVNGAVAKLVRQHPGLTFTKVVSTVDYTRNAYSATLRTMLEGMALAAIVVWLFLRDWRSTAITAIAMPVSLIPTFTVMIAFNFSLNVITLLGLTLVIGILVDDAIVEIENIQKRIQAGARPYRAAMEGADQIGLAVVATTATIMVVFAPVSFMNNIPGQFFREFGITVVAAVLFSLLTARLLTPLLAAYFLKPIDQPHPRGDLRPTYRRLLEWALSHRIVTVVIGGVIFGLSLGLTLLLPTGVQPPGNPDYMYVSLQGPPGATMADMERISRDTTRLLRSQPETDMVFVQVGSTAGEGFAGGLGGGATKGTATVLLKKDRALTVNQIQDRIRSSLRSIPDARVSFDSSGFGAAALQVLLTSQDGRLLDKTGEELQREMRGVGIIADPRPSNPPTGPEIAIRPKPEEAARLGVTVDSIAALARVATLGDIDANVPKLTEGERRIPVRLRLPVNARADLEQIKALRVPTASGGTTSLASVADITFQAGPAQIYRYARKRDIAIDADLVNGAQLGEALKEINKLPIMRNLPPGVERATLGQEEQYRDLFGQLGVAILTGVGLIYGVLVLLFRSFFKPITILSALPLAIGGAFLGLLFAGLSLSLPSLIGLFLLLGLAAKNSILLVEYAIEREREGMSQRDAIIEACRERARPIIMTSVAMAAGMLPTALAIGKGSEFRQPMAVAVIGGLITSTILSLVMVPVVYEMIDDFERWLSPRLARLVTPVEAPPPPAPEDRL